MPKEFLDQNWRGSGLGQHPKNFGPLIFAPILAMDFSLQIWYITWGHGIVLPKTTFTTKDGVGVG